MHEGSCPRSGSVGGAAPRLFRPMYARANMGHPSSEAGLVVCSRVGRKTASVLGEWLHHDAGFHDPGDVLHDRDVVQGIRGHGDQVGVLAGFDGAQILVKG
jgi:hypothetical protein